ncbi:hypothetical protein HII31_00842 [Pseudocercospora fuligena]|uniref:Uncharacterized protein n=1 Tax=Pseudocercospora fuligena TaxID=685502 RepID=A0A8H6RVP6_9PEZI|nr:hypothetical protein HII31_00842 [Pseudocercospora fuligena]
MTSACQHPCRIARHRQHATQVLLLHLASLSNPTIRLGVALASADSSRHIENESNRLLGPYPAYNFGEYNIPARNEAFDNRLWIMLADWRHLRFMRNDLRLPTGFETLPSPSATVRCHDAQSRAACTLPDHV